MADLLQENRATEVEAPAPTTIIVEKSVCGSRWLIALTLLVSLTALGVGVAGLYLQHQTDLAMLAAVEPVIVEVPVETEPPLEYISLYGKQVAVYPDLPKNEYDMEAFSTEDGFTLYDGARRGIDVSSHQGDIDWAKVAADGVEFAFIRIGFRGYGEEGKMVMDETFATNLAGAKENGIEVGAYFFSQATSVWEAKEEAYFALDILDGATLDLPVVFDWEFISHSADARTANVSGKGITLYTLAFSEIMEQAGYQPCAYFNSSMAYLHLELSELADYPFWLAAYRETPNFHYHFDIWQYSDEGTVDGIDGAVDLNLMFTDVMA